MTTASLWKMIVPHQALQQFFSMGIHEWLDSNLRMTHLLPGSSIPWCTYLLRSFGRFGNARILSIFFYIDTPNIVLLHSCKAWCFHFIAAAPPSPQFSLLSDSVETLWRPGPPDFCVLNTDDDVLLQTSMGTRGGHGSNEFTAQAWDFFSDATVEINSFYAGAGINGVITDFPKTSDRYWSNLTEVDVVEPPLPSVAAKTPTSTPFGTASAPRSPNGQPRVVASVIALLMALLLAMYLLF
ncbi:hypothetical protein V6N11_037591 [Hibiscus sabdariffa]|uniref:glycerophosphodiester phosphodiesterase n=1 Tax=Hibiscus sabdariffa TaxID=183260 RepID=A0ABR2PBQ5_9ROSI